MTAHQNRTGARLTAHLTAQANPAARAEPHGRTANCKRAHMRNVQSLPHPHTHAGLTHVQAVACGGVRPCAPAASAGCACAVRCAGGVRLRVRTFFTHTHY